MSSAARMGGAVVAGVSLPSPRFEGCGAIFNETEARHTYEQVQRRYAEERRRISERQNAEGQLREVRSALTQATTPDEIGVLLRQMLAGSHLVTGQPEWSKWGYACRDAWLELVSTNLVGVQHADIVCLRLQKSPLMPVNVVEIWRRPAWLHEIRDKRYWLDDGGTVWQEPHVCPGRSWEAPHKAIEMIVHTTPGIGLTSAAVKRVREATRSASAPRRWDWTLKHAHQVKLHERGFPNAPVLAETMLSLLADTADAVPTPAPETRPSTLCCPNCGAETRPARRCRYCAAELS